MFKDSIDGINPKSRSSSGLFLIILVLFIVGGFYFTIDEQSYFTDHMASEDFSSLVYAFQSIAYGDISGFIEGLVGGITVVGLFMVMFALLHFIFTTALKSIFTKNKYATVLSVVISAYAFIDYRIYNYLINLNSFAIAFFVFIALVIMLWSFTDKGVKDVRGSFKDVQRLKKNPELIKDKDYVKKLRQLIDEEQKRKNI